MIRLVLLMAAAHDFDIETTDVLQVYFQSYKSMLRPAFIKDAVSEFELSPDETLQLLKLPYGLSESSDRWFETFDNHQRKQFGIGVLRNGPALYVRREGKEVIVPSGTYVDDMVRVDTKRFRKISKKRMNYLRWQAIKSCPPLFVIFVTPKKTTGRLF